MRLLFWVLLLKRRERTYWIKCLRMRMSRDRMGLCCTKLILRYKPQPMHRSHRCKQQRVFLVLWMCSLWWWAGGGVLKPGGLVLRRFFYLHITRSEYTNTLRCKNCSSSAASMRVKLNVRVWSSLGAPPCTLHTALCIAHRPAHCIPPCALHTADEQWRRDLGDVILNEEEIKLLDAMRNRCASAHLWSGVQLVPGAVFPGPWRSLHLPVYGLVSIWYQEQCFQDPGGVCICLFTAWYPSGTRSSFSRTLEEFAYACLRPGVLTGTRSSFSRTLEEFAYACLRPGVFTGTRSSVSRILEEFAYACLRPGV